MNGLLMFFYVGCLGFCKTDNILRLNADNTTDDCTSNCNLVQRMSDVISSIGWKRTCILFDSDHEEEASLATDLLSSKGVKLVQYSISQRASNRQVLQKSYGGVSATRWRHYIVIGSGNTTRRLFEEVNSFDSPGLSRTAMKAFSMWIVLGKGVTSQQFDDVIGNISHATVLEKPRRQGHINIHNATLLYASNDTEYVLSTALFEPCGRTFKVVFNSSKHLLSTLSLRDIFPNVDNGLNGFHVRVTTLEWPLFVYSNTSPDGRTSYTGLCMDILEEASRRLNFSYSIMRPADGEWGRRVNDTWTGLIGDIVYDKADLLVAPASVQEERIAVMDFTTAFFTDHYNIVFRLPDKEKTRWLIPLRPFNWRVFIAVAGVFPVVTLSLWLCERYSPLYRNCPRRSIRRGLHQMDECVIYMLGAFFIKSGIYMPRSLSGRTIMSFWWMFVVLIAAAYCGNLIAFLTVNRQDKPFTTISGMLKQDRYNWGTNTGTYLFQLLQTSMDREYRAVWNGIERFAQTQPDVVHQSNAVHKRLLATSDYVYIGDSTLLDVLLSTNCDLVKGREEFLMLQYSIGLPKDSAYTQMFTEQIRLFRESGLIELWIQKWAGNSSLCSAALLTQAKTIMFVDIQSSLYVLACGAVLSIFILLAEIYVFPTESRSTNSKKHI